MTEIKAEYISHMGSDLTVVNSARVSFNKEKDEFEDKDKKLIRYLATHNHWTPFSHPQITLREEVPIFVARQRFKHMVGFTYNEVSRRYVDSEPECYFPDIVRKRPEGSVKQGSGDTFTGYENEKLQLMFVDVNQYCENMYNHLLESGVAPEQARMVLPQSMMTSYYVTGSLAAFARAYSQRIDSHAQKEIQDLAVDWGNIIEPLFPVSWKYLTQGE